MNMRNFRTYQGREHALTRGGNTVTIMEAAPGVVAQILYTDAGASYNFRVSGAAPAGRPSRSGRDGEEEQNPRRGLLRRLLKAREFITNII